VHSLADVEETIKAFSEVREKLSQGKYNVEKGIVAMGDK
jgi:hypothetical protein